MKRICDSKGFLLAEVILVLLIVSSLVPITISCIRVLSSSLTFNERVQDEIAIIQLRNYLLSSWDLHVGENEIIFTKEYEERRLYTVNRRLIAGPGTLIFLNDIDYASFYVSGRYVYLKYERNGKSYESLIAEK